MSDVVKEFLGHDHESLGKLLREFESALERNASTEALEKLDLFWARLAMHIRAENVCLFPALLNAKPDRFSAMGAPSLEDVRLTMTELRADHDFFMRSLGKAVGLMRELSASPKQESAPLIAEVKKTVAIVQQRLDQHNQIEEQKLYQWPTLLIEPRELARLMVEIRRQIENLPPRFRPRAPDGTI